MTASLATTLAQEVRAIPPRQRVHLEGVATFRVRDGRVHSTLSGGGWKRGERRAHDFSVETAQHAGRAILSLARKCERTGFATARHHRRLRQLAGAYIAVAKAAQS